MSFLLQPDILRYACTCGKLKPLSRIYFCRHCLKIRCGYCVCHEVDSHYCPHCLENLPSSEAKLKKNRCANCYECPSCMHTLTTRATNIILSAEEAAASPAPTRTHSSGTTTRKMYYLACGYCRWTSRDAGIPDQQKATGGFPEKDNSNAIRINSLIDHYKMVATLERQEKERKKFVPRRSYLHYSEKFGLTAAIARKRSGLTFTSLGAGKDDSLSGPEFMPSVASEEIEPLPEEIFTQQLNLNQITTMSQRLSLVNCQPENVNDLFPIHKHLLIKRSQRCRNCEHNVTKSEYNPVSIKFKIQLSAYYHVPEIRIITCEPLKAGQKSQLLLKFCNPTQYQTTIHLAPLPSQDEVMKELEQEILQMSIKNVTEKNKEEKTKEESLSSLPALSRQPSLIEEPRPVEIQVTGEIDIPESPIILPPRDDAAEYDDSGESHNLQYDPKVILWIKSNKAAVKLNVTPNENLKKDDTVIAGFLMKYTYMNTILTHEQKEPQRVDLKVKIYINAGKIYIQ